MTRSEFVFTIGFQGDTAIVDKRAQRAYARLSTLELAREGLSRAAFCSALYSGNETEMQAFVEYFGEQAGARVLAVDDLKRLFGVYTVPDEVRRTVAL